MLWIIFDMRRGACPRAAVDGVSSDPLDKKPSARIRLSNFMAASRWLLGPRAVDLPHLGGGPTTRCLAFRHLAVANTFSALDAKVCWQKEELREAQRRVPLLRRTSSEAIQTCLEDKPTLLRVKKINFSAPPLGPIPPGPACIRELRRRSCTRNPAVSEREGCLTISTAPG